MAWSHQSERGDPLKILERRESGPVSRTCAGCAQIRIVPDPFGGRKVLRCGAGKEVGQRCRDYEERAQ